MRIERSYGAPPWELWELWTTKAGIESWWGPEGFRVEVQRIELRAGGRLKYRMIAEDPSLVEGLRSMGVPLVTDASATFVEVEPPYHLVYRHRVDFIAGVDPYEVRHEVELLRTPRGTRLVLTMGRMHDREWSGRARMGWVQELGKLARAIAARRTAARARSAEARGRTGARGH